MQALLGSFESDCKARDEEQLPRKDFRLLVKICTKDYRVEDDSSTSSKQVLILICLTDHLQMLDADSTR